MKIYRAMLQSEWEQVCDRQYFGEAELRQFGFIRCVTAELIPSMLEQQFQNREEPIVLLRINTDLVIHQIKWEDPAYTGIDSPRIYGLLNLNAVDQVFPIMEQNGYFSLPKGLE